MVILAVNLFLVLLILAELAGPSTREKGKKHIFIVYLEALLEAQTLKWQLKAKSLKSDLDSFRG
jgi:hypothetical protein